MRTVFIKEVSELNERELELLLKDKTLQGDIVAYAHDMESYHINDMFDYIKPYLSDYNIAPYEYSYMRVSNITGFIDGMVKLNNDYYILDDEMINILKLAIEVSNTHRSAEIGSDLYYDSMDNINVYINELVEYLSNEFVNVLQYYDSFETVFKTSDYVDIYLEYIFNSECLIDDNKVTLL